jgi:hypothetical protein
MTTRTNLSATFILTLPIFFVNMMEDAVDQRVVVVITDRILLTGQSTGCFKYL